MHWDFLYLGDSFEGNSCLLVTKDAATHYSEFVACEIPAAEVYPVWVANGLGERLWESLQVQSSLRAQHALEGRAEICCGVLPTAKRNHRAREPGCDPGGQGAFAEVQTEQARMDVSGSARASNLEPLASGFASAEGTSQVFTGLTCASPLTELVSADDVQRVVSVYHLDPRTEAKLATLRKNLRMMHLQVKSQNEKQIRYGVEENKVKPVDCCVGNYVLRPCVDEKRGPGKLVVTGIDPLRVVDACEYC